MNHELEHPINYVLDGKEPVPCRDVLEWAKHPNHHMVVQQTRIPDWKGVDIVVSTVFLGIDHNFFAGPPILFETMVFGGPCDGDMERYTTWDEAETGHAAMVERALKES